MIITTTPGAARFVSLGDDWRRLQAWGARVDRLPGDAAGFAERYGTFTDKTAVTAFIAAVNEARALAASVGGPAALKRALMADPGLLNGTEPPEGLYAGLAWLAGVAGNAASTMAETLERIPSMLEGEGSPEERAEALRSVLCGPDGLSFTAAVGRDDAAAVRERAAGLVDPLGEASRALGADAVPNEAGRQLGALRSALPRLREQAAEAERRWKKWSPLGPSREEREAEYRRLEAEVQAAEAELEQKERFAADINGFYPDNARVVPAVLEVDGQLRRLEALFADTAAELTQLCSIASEEQLSDPAWVSRALDITGAVPKWRELAEAARAFQENVLVEPPVLSQNES
jgi:hypothetical protein